MELVRKEIQLKSSPPYTFKMTDYRRMKCDHKEWSSPEFISQPGGYNMRMTVYPGGNDNMTGHLSLYISLCAGPNDKELAWPFVGSITIQILNQNEDKSHYSKSIPLRIMIVSEDEQNSRRGLSDFIPHAVLEEETSTCLYIDFVGCIYFRILAIKVSSFCCPWLICFPS